MDYKPSGVCSRLIHVELDGDKIANVEFVGGCAGRSFMSLTQERDWLLMA